MKKKYGQKRMRHRICEILLAGVLAASTLAGCSDDWEEYEEPAVSQESTAAAEAGTEGRTGASEAGAAGADTEALVRGSGLDIGTVTSEVDDNPARAVRRSTKPIRQVLITMLDGTAVPEDFYLYRNNLSEQYQRAYDQICQGLVEGAECINMTVPVLESDMENVYFSVVYDHPELFWVVQSYRDTYNNNGYVTAVYPSYYTSDISGMASEVAQSVNAALADMWELGSDIERVKYAHDYLTNRVSYVRNDLDQTAYSGFVWGQTVCTGYAKCFAYMMHRMGIPCTVVLGQAGENHAWNLLELDGEYYMMDVTWDDPVGNPADTYYYDYFNITDSQIAKDHTRSGNLEISLYLPEANGTRYSYANAFGGNAYGTDFDALNGTVPDTYSEEDWYTTPDEEEGYVYNDEETAQTEDGWWNLLDPDWTLDDWEYDDGVWYIWDEETQFIYAYLEEEDIFGAMEEDSDEFYWLDPESGEWIAE